MVRRRQYSPGPVNIMTPMTVCVQNDSDRMWYTAISRAGNVGSSQCVGKGVDRVDLKNRGWWCRVAQTIHERWGWKQTLGMNMALTMLAPWVVTGTRLWLSDGGKGVTTPPPNVVGPEQVQPEKPKGDFQGGKSGQIAEGSCVFCIEKGGQDESNKAMG